MADSTLVEANSKVRVKTKNPAKTATLLSPQTTDEFHGTSTENNQQSDIHPIQDPLTHVGEGNTTAIGGETLLLAAKNLTGEGTSNNTLTPEEILSMKQQNPAVTLRKPQKLRQASIDVQPSSSIAMPIQEMDASVTLKLQQLKTYLFEHEILASIKEEEALGVDVLKLLDELSRYKLPAPVTKYLIEFETFFTQLVKYLTLRRHSDFQIKTKLYEMRWEWDFNEIFERKLNDFEAKKQERFNKQYAFDQQVSDYQAQIAELTKKIVEVEEQKASLDSTETLPAQDIIN